MLYMWLMRGEDLNCRSMKGQLASTNFRMFREVSILLCFLLIACAYQILRPPPPNICGSPGGPPITGPRIKLADGRHLAYKEHGVPRDIAKHKIVFIHAFDSGKHGALAAKNEVLEELGVYILSFDRPGYGESDPDPKRTIKSLALDVEQLADQMKLGPKFHVVGYSMGGMAAWGCLKYIPHRLAGVAMVAPVINYWWPGFPASLSKEAYYLQLPQDQWTLRVAHYAPWLVYWWNTQKWFPASAVASHNPGILSRQDLEIVRKLMGQAAEKPQVRQQGEYESIHRDLIVFFGQWEFDPMDLKNPFPEVVNVHLWQGEGDRIVPVSLQRYIAGKLPWIHYHEIPGDAGHLFPYADGVGEKIIRSLLLRDDTLTV